MDRAVEHGLDTRRTHRRCWASKGPAPHPRAVPVASASRSATSGRGAPAGSAGAGWTLAPRRSPLTSGGSPQCSSSASRPRPGRSATNNRRSRTRRSWPAADRVANRWTSPLEHLDPVRHLVIPVHGVPAEHRHAEQLRLGRQRLAVNRFADRSRAPVAAGCDGSTSVQCPAVSPARAGRSSSVQNRRNPAWSGPTWWKWRWS